jgi:D-alanyl-D-alanine carboxypeptidase
VKNRSVSRNWPAVLFLLLASLAGGLAAPPASAAEKYAAIVVDGNTGQTLYARNADARRYPASLTKMMTLYVLFEELEAGRFTLESKLSVSANAAKQSPSKLGVRAGSSIKVEAAILGLTTKSANDVAVVVAENTAGSVSGFVARMNRTARALGMSSTTFRNPHGLPDSGQVTTARDLVKLARGLQDRFPTYYRYFGVKTFTYGGHRHRNHNHLLGSVTGVDGIKTGYTRASGFNLVTNVRRDNRHIIAVVMGGKTAGRRDAEMRRLISAYLSRAKKGSGSDALIIANATVTETGATDSVHADVRLPRARPDAEGERTLAYTESPPASDIVGAAMAELVSETATAQGDIADDAVDPIGARIGAATEVAKHATADIDPLARLTELARLRAGERDLVAAGPAPPSADANGESGWHIQIGAVPTREAAEALLEKAKSSAGPVLQSRQSLTLEVERDGTRLYRARFGGFSDKEQARAACAKLKRHAIACLAVPS